MVFPTKTVEILQPFMFVNEPALVEQLRGIMPDTKFVCMYGTTLITEAGQHIQAQSFRMKYRSAGNGNPDPFTDMISIIAELEKEVKDNKIETVYLHSISTSGFIVNPHTFESSQSFLFRGTFV